MRVFLLIVFTILQTYFLSGQNRIDFNHLKFVNSKTGSIVSSSSYCKLGYRFHYFHSDNKKDSIINETFYVLNDNLQKFIDSLKDNGYRFKKNITHKIKKTKQLTNSRINLDSFEFDCINCFKDTVSKLKLSIQLDYGHGKIDFIHSDFIFTISKKSEIEKNINDAVFILTEYSYTSMKSKCIFLDDLDIFKKPPVIFNCEEKTVVYNKSSTSICY